MHRDRRQIVGCQGPGGRMGSNCSLGFLCGDECSGTRQRWWLHNIVNVLNATLFENSSFYVM